MTQYAIHSHGVDETIVLGRRIGRAARAGDVIALFGELGAGKTQLAKGIAVGAGVPDARNVTSPTFVLIREYEGRLTVYHVDAYRLAGADDMEALGADELFYGDGLCVIEWPERILAALPARRLDIALEHLGPEDRRITLTPHGGRYEQLLNDLAGTRHPPSRSQQAGAGDAEG